MSVDLKTIKTLTKHLASIKLKKYSLLSEIKDDFDSIATKLIDVDNNDDELIESLNTASDYFNLLTEEDFETSNKQKVSESKAVISKFTKELNAIIVKWRKNIGQL